ncbi:LysR family transcriptional regulator [Flavobacterium alkalisoli]|uniref:LysR family transcriptional regulator n=1 Tax=Flavobacterium alkalisoli TaxID=2602769 RepID=A0A5B9FZG9_9FLAO|nr:hydrogen peroxide-inducible genes activator [Flavobacterium alkalisoli]QEE50382.1 LysR family transcriptional regulator [Flavobacterium alkalisoli]
MTIQQLKYITALDEHRNFVKAAEECMVTQPGLTIQLKNLEEEIGVKIFDRTKVPLKPTKAGKEIISRAKKILREVEGIREFVIYEKNQLEGECTIGVISTLSPYLVPQFIKKMKEVAPKMHFTIKELPTGLLINNALTGDIDIALMATPTGANGLKEYPVFYEPFVAYLHEAHKMRGAEYYELQPQDKPQLLLLEHEYCYNAQLLDICGLTQGADKHDGFTYDISSIETLKNLVKADLGFAILPLLSVINEKENPMYKEFKDPKPVREISLVVAETFSRKLLLQKISETIYACLPESMKQDFKYKKIQWNDSPYFIESVKGFL